MCMVKEVWRSARSAGYEANLAKRHERRGIAHSVSIAAIEKSKTRYG
ncbi:hypothetical protein DSM112329_01820 [Paraconexibacter sp. AEG42_29]|uniref:Uncharacterized protein n=1 Tax=Paraconexibacter sp. AEG42_29 TaxID=2997339 RepID=A0AAU7ATP7_9ACTN